MASMIDTLNRLLPVFEAPAHLDLYDIEHAAYDVQLSVTTLVGLINHDQPRVYLLATSDAGSLFNALLAHVPHEHVAHDGVDILEAMLQTYRDSAKGMVIYDPALPDSVNVATTLAGQRDAIVVSPQQAAALQQKPYQLPVVADLRVYHWKNRLQAYRWARSNLLKEASGQLVAGLHPKIAGALRSYLVATRAFVYWLNPLNLLPDPTAGWISERCLMKHIMRAYPPGALHLGWFINEFGGVDMTSKAGLYLLPSDYFYNLEVWSAVRPPVRMEDVGGVAYRVTNVEDAEGESDSVAHKEGADNESGGEARAAQAPHPPSTSSTPAPTESGAASRRGGGGVDGWMGRLRRPRPPIAPNTSYIESGAASRRGGGGVDGWMGRLRRPRPPIASNLPGMGNDPASHIPIYLSFTISDGDNLQYDQHRMYQLWQDRARGSIPLGWTISSALIEAAPTLAAYYRNTATHNDELVAGPSGAAYMWPSSWSAKRLSAFLHVTGELMQRMDMRTIEVLDGALSRFFPYRPWQERYARLLSPFGVRGILLNDSYRHGGWRVVAGMPVIKNLGIAKSVAQTLELIKNNTPPQLKGPTFLNVYVYAWRMTPADIRAVMQRLDGRYKVVTPGQLCALIARSQEQA